jgi:hypothetical protein
MTKRFFRERAVILIFSITFALGLMSFQALVMAQSLTTIGQETLIPLPADATWQVGLNFLPASNDVVNLNPPQFQWCYATNIAALPADKLEKTFVFQVAYDAGFQNLAVNVVTRWNFYNSIAPFTNSPCYWRVGYVSGVTNPLSTNVYCWSPTYQFTISPNAAVWDRSMLANTNYLASKAQHPYLMLNATNNSVLLNWLNNNLAYYWTNQTSTKVTNANRINYDSGASWRTLQTNALRLITNSWWPSNQPPASYGLYNWPEYTGEVAFMWAVTGSAVWSNAQPNVALDLIADDYLTNTGCYANMPNCFVDPIYSSLCYNEGIALALGYDWCYNLLTYSQRTNILNALAMRCRYVLKGSALVWTDGNPPCYNGVGDPTGQYTNGAYVPQWTLANYGRSHATDDFYLAMLQAIAGYNDHPWCADLFNMGVNYMTGPTYCYRNAMGVGRSYTLVHTATSRILATQLIYQSTFPEVAWTNNPFFQQLGDWWDRIEPVGYAAGHEAWGDCGFGQLNDWFSMGRNLALVSQNGNYFQHWWNQENFYLAQNHGPPQDDMLSIAIPFNINCNLPMVTTTNFAEVLPATGWMFSSSASPSTAAGFTNGVGIVFQARPTGCVNGHDFYSDGSFQMWAYGAAVTDAGGCGSGGSADISAYPHVPWAHNTLIINGLGQCQPYGMQCEPYYARFTAFTNNASFTYCAADLTRAYMRSNIYSYPPMLNDEFDNLYVPASRTSFGPLYCVTNVTRQLLFNRHEYLVVFDTVQTSNPPTNTFSWVYHILPPTLSLNTSNMSFTYTVTNFYNNSNVNVYVAFVNNPSELTVTTMTGATPSANYRMNPFTGENYWTNSQDDYGDYVNQSSVLWFNNAQPTNSFTFMTVIYPVPPGGSAPQITPLDDYTVAITNGAQGDVITFNPNTSYTPTLVVNAIGSPGPIVQVLSPPSDLRVITQ